MLLCDGAADRLGVTAQPRVLGADDALQLGELAHELRGLVRLGQPGGLARVFVSVELPDELDEPRRLVRERAAALDERDPLQRRASSSMPTATSRSKVKAASSSRASSTCV